MTTTCPTRFSWTSSQESWTASVRDRSDSHSSPTFCVRADWRGQQLDEATLHRGCRAYRLCAGCGKEGDGGAVIASKVSSCVTLSVMKLVNQGLSYTVSSVRRDAIVRRGRFSSHVGEHSSYKVPVEVMCRLTHLFDHEIDTTRRLHAHRRNLLELGVGPQTIFDYFVEVTKAVLRAEREALWCRSNLARVNFPRY